MGEYVITAGLTDSGILGKSDVSAKIFNKNTITIDMFGNAFFRQFKYKIVTHARVFSLIPKIRINKYIGLAITSSLKFLPTLFGYNNMCSWNKVKKMSIKLPVNNGQIDFEFMEEFITDLESQQISEVTNFLMESGLDDHELTEREKEVLEKLDNVEWKLYEMGNLFERIKTNKLPYKAKDLPDEPRGEYVLPCLTSSFKNQGLNYYAPKAGATILKDVISIPSNSDVYRAYYQSREFTVLSDAYTIRWKQSDSTLTPKQYLFMVVSINKITNLPRYSYKNKLGGWNVVKNKYISLPTKNDEIDFDFMEIFIKAIQKLLIQDVVLWTSGNIEESKEEISDYV